MSKGLICTGTEERVGISSREEGGDKMQQMKPQDDLYKHLTPRERMRIRKMQEAYTCRKAPELRQE